MRHYAYIDPRQNQHGHVVEVREGRHVQAIEVAETLRCDAIRRACSEYQFMTGRRPDSAEII